MGNQHSRQQTSFEMDDLPRPNIKRLVKRAISATSEGNDAMERSEYNQAYTAYRYAFGLIDYLINQEGLGNTKQSERLAQCKVTLGYKLYDLKAFLFVEGQRREEEERSIPKVVLSKNDLYLPNHVLAELQKKKKSVNETSEEALAFKRLLNNLEVCVPKMQMSEIIGQKDAISLLEDTIVERNLRPDLFQHTDQRGVLLYGPPGKLQKF